MRSMDFYLKAAMEGAMKIQEVILRALAKKITWWQAAEIIGISGRQMRRWHERHDLRRRGLRCRHHLSPHWPMLNTPSVTPTCFYSLIYSFTGNPNGCGPWGPLYMDSTGNLYGTTSCDDAAGAGNIFKLTPSGSGWTYTSLHDFFIDRHDGANPIRRISKVQSSWRCPGSVALCPRHRHRSCH